MDLNFSVQNKKPVIYLAGHVKEKEYRDYCIEKYSKDFMLFDPIREIDENVIRENNKSWIRNSFFNMIYSFFVII